MAHAFLRAVSPFVATSSLDLARAFSVLCRAFEPDISESIVNSSPGQTTSNLWWKRWLSPRTSGTPAASLKRFQQSVNFLRRVVVRETDANHASG